MYSESAILHCNQLLMIHSGFPQCSYRLPSVYLPSLSTDYTAGAHLSPAPSLLTCGGDSDSSRGSYSDKFAVCETDLPSSWKLLGVCHIGANRSFLCGRWMPFIEKEHWREKEAHCEVGDNCDWVDGLGAEIMSQLKASPRLRMIHGILSGSSD